MLKPLTIKNLSFHTNLIQGPLAGVSCAPFRTLTWQYGKPAFSCTEMISCKTLINQPPKSILRYSTIDQLEGPVCFQLSGSEPRELAEATKVATSYGATLIDLNCGCPVKKIRDKGAGSILLNKPKQLYSLITAMKQNTHLPISIKIRVQGNNNEKFNQELVHVINDSGLDCLIVHGRDWTEKYDRPCRYDEIQFFVERLKIPVIGNGDITDLTSLKKMLATGCAGAMIGRAGVGQPWLVAKLTAEISNQSFTIPDHTAIGKIFLRHVQQLAHLLKSEKLAVLQARKFAKYYAGTLLNKKKFSMEINTCDNLKDLNLLCMNYFH